MTQHNKARYIEDALGLILILALDRLTKRLACAYLTEGVTAPLIKGVIGLHLTNNTGAAFGLFSGGAWVLTAVTALLLALLAGWYVKKRGHSGFLRLGTVLTVAGGLGNLYDRVIYGSVIDFIEPLFVRFAVFNVADIAVVIGACALVIGLLKSEDKGDADVPR